MRVTRLTDQDVQGWDNQKLVDEFEITSRKCFDGDYTTAEQHEHAKNLATIKQEVFRRLKK